MMSSIVCRLVLYILLLDLMPPSAALFSSYATRLLGAFLTETGRTKMKMEPEEHTEETNGIFQMPIYRRRPAPNRRRFTRRNIAANTNSSANAIGLGDAYDV